MIILLKNMYFLYLTFLLGKFLEYRNLLVFSDSKVNIILFK